MKPLKLIAIAALCLTMAGCAGMSAALQYRDTRPVHYKDASSGQVWRVFDKPNEHRLMITPTIGLSMAEGFVRGLTFGAADTDIPKSTYKKAVSDWLTHTGRDCTIIDGYKLIPVLHQSELTI